MEVNFIQAFLNISKQEASFLARQRYQSNLSLDRQTNTYKVEIPNPYIDDFTLRTLTNPYKEFEPAISHSVNNQQALSPSS